MAIFVDYGSKAQQIAEREAAVQAWRHPVEIMEPPECDEHIEDLADLLTPIFLFISKGRLGGTMDLRAWVTLHETKMDLIGRESIQTFAARRGVPVLRMHELVKEFRSMLPPSRGLNRKSSRIVGTTIGLRAGQGLTRQNPSGARPPHPPGRKSPLPPSWYTGSAMG